jgi:NitT/TauT family transport system substrate-binding protein
MDNTLDRQIPFGLTIEGGSMRNIARSRWTRVASLAAVGVLALSACSSSDSSSEDTATEETAAEETAEDTATEETEAEEASDAQEECAELTPASLQLQWFVQAQFAGYYAAKDLGFYEAACLDVEILEGGVDIVPQTVLAQGGSDFAIAWVPKALSSREQGAGITDIAQVFQRSGTLQVAWADSGIETPADFAGKKIGNWGFGNEYEIFAALSKEGLDPASDVELVQQQFDMVALLNREIDAAEAMTYNEYAQLLEAVNPDTGELYQPEDFNVINYADYGVGMLQDAIWASEERLADPEYQDLAERFVTASFEGWIYCRDNPQECADIVTANGSQLGASHQLWMMNEVNKLVWPSPNGIGIIDSAEWDQTVAISLDTPNLEGATVVSEAPADTAYTNQFAEAANAALQAEGVDTTGDGFTPIEVTLNEGGA